MNLPNSVRIRYDDLRSLDWTLITANYVGIGASIENPIRILKVCNTTDANLILSFNGLDDKDIFPRHTYNIIDYGANKAFQGGYLELPAGDRIYVKAEDGVVPTLGKIYITLIYASQA